MIQAHYPDDLYHSNSLLFVGSQLCAGSIGAFRRNIAGAHNLPPADAHLRSNKCYLNRDNAQLG
jgi:hypothetical protein